MLALIPIENSTQLEAYRFDPLTNVMALRFKHGSTVYHFQNVPADVAERFAAAESKGKFFYAQIKGKFEFDRVVTNEARAAAERG